MAEGAEFIMPLMIGFLVVGLVMSLGGPTGKLLSCYESRCTAVVLSTASTETHCIAVADYFVDAQCMSVCTHVV
jgi:glycerol uptake facilitator-like aquaporin